MIVTEVTGLVVYGTLQDPMVLRAVLGRLPELRPVRLPGMRAAPLRDRIYPGLVADETAVCRGLVMEVSADELAVMDDFEAPEFVRRPVTPAGPSAPVDAGEVLQAYLLGDEDQDLALPGTWSLAAFQLAPEHATYLDRITAWVTTR